MPALQHACPRGWLLHRACLRYSVGARPGRWCRYRRHCGSCTAATSAQQGVPITANRACGRGRAGWQRLARGALRSSRSSRSDSRSPATTLWSAGRHCHTPDPTASPPGPTCSSERVSSLPGPPAKLSPASGVFGRPWMANSGATWDARQASGVVQTRVGGGRRREQARQAGAAAAASRHGGSRSARAARGPWAPAARAWLRSRRARCAAAARQRCIRWTTYRWLLCSRLETSPLRGRCRGVSEGCSGLEG